MVHSFENRVQPMEQLEDGSYSDYSVNKVRGSALTRGDLSFPKVQQSKLDQGVLFLFEQEIRSFILIFFKEKKKEVRRFPTNRCWRRLLALPLLFFTVKVGLDVSAPSDITDAAASSPPAEPPLPLTHPGDDRRAAALTAAASGMGEAEAEGKLLRPLGVSQPSPLPVSLQEFASWARGNIHKKECCFFEREKR